MKATVPIFLLSAALPIAAHSDEAAARGELNREFEETIKPFVSSYCSDCHGGDKPKAKFDLSVYQTLDSVAIDFGHWDLVLERLDAKEMPPEDAEKQPDNEVREKVIGWVERLRRHEADRNAGDPGPVLARRLSNAEFDYSIHDLTGVDIRPTREFPIDPANEAGFDNTGESLAISPALLNKYLAAARHVADHLLFLPEGLGFAPHPVVAYSDRDKYCVHRIADFYKAQPTDYADYFRAAWRFRHRSASGEPEKTLEEFATAEGVSAMYLQTLWTLLSDSENNAGPIAALRKRWNTLADAEADEGALDSACESLRTFVFENRKKYELKPAINFKIRGLHSSNQAIVLWKDRELAALRRRGQLPESDGSVASEELRDAIVRFCEIFPDAFVVSERGRMFLPPEKRNKGRLLSAGFHMMLGYFRDDAPLYDLLLDEAEQEELDALWDDLEFIPQTPVRQFADFIYLERGESPAFLQSEEFAFARQDADVTSEEKMHKLAKLYLAKVREARIDEKVIPIIDGYFQDMASRVRRLEKIEREARPRHLQALVELASRAWQRPLSDDESEDLRSFYNSLIEDEGLGHEEAVRDVLASVLVSPRFFYRTTVADAGTEPTPLTDQELASRLSYFLWSGLPDAELLDRAQAGALDEPEILLEQTRRMLADPRMRRFAVEFGGNWLDFRRFESHKGVNRDRFPAFDHHLRQAMFEEPVRFIADIAQNNGSVLDFLDGTHTFVNPVLAKHYGLPEPVHGWQRVENADEAGRGGLLPMSVFLTTNSPGLRTSPVKRGHWVVRRLLGERIPPPPPQVPELPEDESKLGELSLRETLARHRDDQSCASCHQRFDGIGLVFEGYGPVGERREMDLGGRRIDATAVFPDGSQGEGLDGLRSYLREHRRAEFADNFCRKLLSYALGRSLLLSDDSTVEKMKQQLANSDYRFQPLVETIVTSPQFLRKRGRDHRATREQSDEPSK
jgi:hypothetical protein